MVDLELFEVVVLAVLAERTVHLAIVEVLRLQILVSRLQIFVQQHSVSWPGWLLVLVWRLAEFLALAEFSARTGWSVGNGWLVGNGWSAG